MSEIANILNKMEPLKIIEETKDSITSKDFQFVETVYYYCMKTLNHNMLLIYLSHINKENKKLNDLIFMPLFNTTASSDQSFRLFIKDETNRCVLDYILEYENSFDTIAKKYFNIFLKGSRLYVQIIYKIKKEQYLLKKNPWTKLILSIKKNEKISLYDISFLSKEIKEHIV